MTQTKKPKSGQKVTPDNPVQTGVQRASGKLLLELTNKHNQELKDSGQYLENARTAEEVMGNEFAAVTISRPRKKKG